MIPEYFRGVEIPPYITNKTSLIAWVLKEFMNDEPISNWEFVADLHCHRFGGVLHNLRKEGWEITTLPSKKRGLCHYYATSIPTRALATIR
jgi:hypothetical protein